MVINNITVCSCADKLDRIWAFKLSGFAQFTFRYGLYQLMDFTSQTHCLNCGAALSQQFCGQCGQAMCQRLSLKQVVVIVQRGLVEFKSPFLQLFFGLLFKPAITCREYIQGKRVKYFNPVRFAFWLFTAMILLASWQGVNLLEWRGPHVTVNFENNQSKILAALQNALVYLYFLSPIVMAFSTKLFFRKQGFNVAELYIAHLLILALITLLHIYALAIGSYGTQFYLLLYYGVSFVVTLLVTARLYQPTKISYYFRAFMATLVGYIGVLLIFSGVIAVYVGFFEAHSAAQNP